MQGQWLGKNEGTNEGSILVDLDDRQDHFQGSAYLFEDNPEIPGTHAFIKTTDKCNDQRLEVDLLPIHPDHPTYANPADFEHIAIPKKADLHIKRAGVNLEISWETSVGTAGTGVLKPSRANQVSEYVANPEVCRWEDFRKFVEQLQPRKYIFRGQPSNWRLRTSFHRTKRKDLIRLQNEDVSALYRATVRTTSHVFNRSNPDENGAFWHLIQLHGFPTPLLDWSYSPHVAAYFAFRSVRPPTEKGKPVRIMMFDAESWRNDWIQLTHLTLCRPHFSIIDALAIGNERALPQQSLATVTNIDDIESYIKSMEEKSGKTYLKVFDLETDDRSKILDVLSMMGITHGSLFPGLDGICQEIRDREFGLPDNGEF